MSNEQPETTLTDGSPVTPDHREINPATGMQKAYVVLSEAERAKGFVRPVRRTYIHRGVRPQHPTRDLTEAEQTLYAGYDYVAYETYPANSRLVGKFWTRKEMTSGCGATTTMALSLAETYARDPKFYSGTFCCRCSAHYGVEQFVWDGTDEVVGS